MAADQLITEHIDLWTAAIKRRSTAGRGSSRKIELYGIKKLRKLILELAVRGLLVPQDPKDEPASELLKKIAAEKAKLVKSGKVKQGKALPPISGDGQQAVPSGWSWTCMTGLGEISPRNDVEDNAIASFVPMPLISTRFDGRHDHELKTWAEIKRGYTHFADGDVAIAKITPCFENSKAAIFSGLNNGVGAGTTELHVVRPYGEFVNRSYLLLYLKSPQFLRVGETKMTGSAGQKRLPTEFFSFNPLPLPPLGEQHRIVAKVDELMALCDLLEQQTDSSLSAHQTLVETLMNALTGAADHAQFASAWKRIAEHFDNLFTTEESIDQLKQTILQLAVMGKLVPQDPNDEPASELLKKIASEKAKLVKEGQIKKENSLSKIGAGEKRFELPPNWEWSRLIEISANIHYGYTASSDESIKNVRLLRITDIQDDLVDWDSVPGCEIEANKVAQYKLVDDDILIARTGGTIGKSYLVQGLNVCSVFASYLIRVRHLKGMSARYKKIYLGSQLYWRQLYAKSMGTGQPNVNGEALKGLVVPVPPLNEQHRIVAKVDELITLCDQLKTRLNHAQTTQIHLADALAEQALVED